ncbi:MAG: bifunctional precorrin-2 dehydrogenase/sirohydrochlorin ferrochelatase [Capsulimonadaceae bacterium]
MKFYSIGLDLAGKACVVVGGGSVACRRARSLIESGGRVRVISPDATPELQSLARDGVLDWIPEPYRPDALDGALLAVAATDDSAVNERITIDGRARGVLVNRVDCPNEGDFIVPATVSRGDLTLTVNTGGASPSLAAVLREDLEAAYGPEWAGLAEVFARLRARLKERHATDTARKQVVRAILDDVSVRDAIRSGNLCEAEARAVQCLSL